MRRVIGWLAINHLALREALERNALISTPSNFVRKQPSLDQPHPNSRADLGFTMVSREYLSMQSRFTHIFVAAVCPLVFCASSLFAQTPAGNSIEVVYNQYASIVQTYNIDRQTGFPTQEIPRHTRCALSRLSVVRP